ncbi:uncharacterized protein TNIN_86731 [Trichonephila inaurata madagascariensis]|uniref:Uncharacterized protein n=1 Tax=Trichonephila inaurata madagascariensis TaxID=2747483 RepID=A0A8X6YY44_9ARAC|nr:uncharacterized protein TNIN_86731 [Trichonephila inaurata madagascariensis]
MAGQRVRIPATKNCAPQATAVCGCGERQPTEVQWKVSVRGSLLPDQGIPSARSQRIALVTVGALIRNHAYYILLEYHQDLTES